MSETVNILDLALDTITKEVRKLHAKSTLAEPLDKFEANCLTDYVKALIVVRKDERDAAKSDSMAIKSDDDLNLLAAEALNYLQSLEKDKETQNEPVTEPSEVQEPKAE